MDMTAANSAKAIAEGLTFGVEIETSGLGTGTLASYIQRGLREKGIAAEYVCEGGYYGKVAVVMADGRKWVCMTDASIRGVGAEVVSPILRGAADMELLQEVVRIVRRAGAKSSAEFGCGIHVHVGVGELDGAALGRLVANVSKFDGFIRQAVNVDASRGRWCKEIEAERVAKLVKAKSKGEIACAWYGVSDSIAVEREAREHYNSARYYGLNLHSVFYANRGTAEFRYFNGTLHAGEVRAFVMLAKGMVARAMVAKRKGAGARKVVTRAQAANVLTEIGIVGDELANVRKHLTKNFAVRAA